MKRVYCLYRVSTKGQVDKEDIPMQRIECHKFANLQPDWKIEKEFYEKGVSGFLVSAEDRDSLREIVAAAKNKEFDILLVYKLDRIGRIESETPIVVQTFVNLGVEVWSTIEGQRKFDNHIDSLINYLYFWQAEGESKNTSIRIKTRMKQLTEDGIYTGGTVPYGYELIDRGRKNKKDVACMDVIVNMQEAEMVQTIFNMTAQLSMGSYRVAEFLNKKGLRTHSGTKFQCNTIVRILKNEMYLGYLVRNGTRSKHLPELQIIDEETFAAAQEIMKKRNIVNEHKNQITASTKSGVLLSGIIFCGHCGGRLTPERYQDRYIRKDGTEYHISELKYCCYHRRRKLCECKGNTSYKAATIDKTVNDIIMKMFCNIHYSPNKQAIEKNLKQIVQSKEATQKKRFQDMEKLKKKIEKLQSEIADALIGESAFDPEQLAIAIKDTKAKLKVIEDEYRGVDDEIGTKQQTIKSIIPNFEKFQGWAKEYELATLDRKKAIVSQLISHVDVSKTGIEITFNIEYEQFCEN